MAISSIIAEAPQVQMNFETIAGNRVEVPPIFQKRVKVDTSQWLVVLMSPNGTAGNIDYVNGTGSGWSTFIVEKPSSDPITGGKFFLLTGRKKPSASTPLVNNQIIVTINALEVGRLYVDAATQTVGWVAFVVPGSRTDPRFVLNGATTTGDLLFGMTGADASLELQLIVGGTEV